MTDRKLAVILHADVVGSTSLVQLNETLAHQRIQDTFRRFSESISRHNGIAHEIRGDALVAEFARASDAVSASIAFQAANATHNEKLTDEIRPFVRVGIAMGEVVVADNTVTGEGVVLAQRLEQLAEPEGVVIQGAAYETVPKRLPFDYENLGERELKGFDEAIRVYAVSLSPGAAVPEPEAQAKQDVAAKDLTDKPSIAVLPFANLSDDPKQEYFSDGITEDIITELSRFSGLIVIARNSSFAYKDLPVDIKQVARELGVGYVMEGSVRRDGDRLRITVQLIEADSGGHIWGEKYDRELGDIFDLQDEITRHVVGSIAPQVELAELERSRKLSDTNLSAYELALKAQALSYDAVRTADPNTLVQAMSLANAALELDNRCTHALWTNGMGRVFQYLYGWSDDPGSALTSAIETASHLIGIDPSNAKSYVVRAWAHQYRREYDLALADYRRALELNPNLALNLFTMAWSEAVAGLAADAKEHAKMALKLSPRDTDIWLGWAYATLELASFIEGGFTEAVKWGRLAIQMHAKMPARLIVMVACYGYLGNLEAAKSHVEVLESFAPKKLPAVLSGAFEVFKLPEHNKLLVEGLRRTGL